MTSTAAHPQTGDSSTRGLRLEQGSKRIRVYLGGELVADTMQPVLVWDVPYYPTYYFPLGDVRLDLLTEQDGVAHSPRRGDGRVLTVSTQRKQAPSAAVRYADSPIEELRDLIRFEWDAMDAWFEEDEEIFTHPRDPYTRVDILPSSRQVLVKVDGVTIAESSSPRLLFETGLPVRYYVPKPHVHMELLEATETVSSCPYKGDARWWSVRTPTGFHEDVAWSYPSPFAESQRIAGMVAFYSEKVDVYVGGVLQKPPA
jgi:uncharacterized protein (DUF427 family)